MNGSLLERLLGWEVRILTVGLLFARENVIIEIRSIIVVEIAIANFFLWNSSPAIRLFLYFWLLIDGHINDCCIGSLVSIVGIIWRGVVGC